jgi:ferredoxin--NADP+ reductase
VNKTTSREEKCTSKTRSKYADEVFEKLENGAHIYFCGLKGMMPGIQDMLKGVAEKKDVDYDAWLKGLKKSKQWHVEVY